MAGELAQLRETHLNCKSSQRSYGAVNFCLEPVLDWVTKRLQQDPTIRGLFDCLTELKLETGFVLDLAEMGEVLGFDLEDIEDARVFKSFCHGGSLGQTSIDIIELRDGRQVLIKHGGSSRAGINPAADIAYYAEAQQVADTVGEDIPKLVWASPRNRRFAMSFMRGSDTGGARWEDFQPHELLTSILFESLIAIGDRHAGNVVEVIEQVIGHVDIGAEFIGTPGQPSSELAYPPYLMAMRDPERLETFLPGWREALLEAFVLWEAQWKPTLAAMELEAVSDEAIGGMDSFFRTAIVDTDEYERIKKAAAIVRRGRDDLFTEAIGRSADEEDFSDETTEHTTAIAEDCEEAQYLVDTVIEDMNNILEGRTPCLQDVINLADRRLGNAEEFMDGVEQVDRDCMDIHENIMIDFAAAKDRVNEAEAFCAPQLKPDQTSRRNAGNVTPDQPRPPTRPPAGSEVARRCSVFDRNISELMIDLDPKLGDALFCASLTTNANLLQVLQRTASELRGKCSFSPVERIGDARFALSTAIGWCEGQGQGPFPFVEDLLRRPAF